MPPEPSVGEAGARDRVQEGPGMFLNADTWISFRHLSSPQNGLRYSFSLQGCTYSPRRVAQRAHPFQARPQAIRTQIRLSSTSSKTLSLKERLAELIPAEIENVRCPAPTSSHMRPAHLFLRSRPPAPPTARRPLAPSRSTSSTGN